MRPEDPRSWIHQQYCECEVCAQYHPAVPRALGWVDLAKLAFFGLATGVAAAALLAPFRTVAAIVTLLGVR